MKKINVYVNGDYICSSNRYKTCKEFKNKILESGLLKWQSIDGEHIIMLKSNGSDKIVMSYK